jgi:predicted nucleic-acid-binding Zn-ribbon protein
MAQSRTSCPRCRQPVMAEVNQLFDTTTDNLAKQKMLSGQFNVIHCQTCGYEGMVATPVIYHDAEKELLLSFFPPEMGLPMTEQEKLMGPLLNQVMNALPQEKRKGYLLRPQTMLSMQHMVERILEADGITKEMIADQQKKVDLIRRLMTTPADQREKLLEDESSLVDETFFGLFSRLLESAAMSQDESAAKTLAEVQNLLLEKTKIGQEIKSQNDEAQAAVKDLQEASKAGLTREALLDLIINAPTDIRLATLVRLARSGLDYNFFQILSNKIDSATGEDKDRLGKLRETLVKMTAEIDLEMQEQVGRVQQVIEKIIQSPEIEKTTEQILPAVNDLFIDVLQRMMEAARQKSDLELLAKYQQIVAVIQKASAPPPEYELLERLLSLDTEEQILAVLNEKPELVTDELSQLISALVNQAETQKEDPAVVEKLKIAHRLVLRLIMKANLAK